MHNRPVYLNLFRLHLPVSGWVSILHRISGLILFLSLPCAVYLLQHSLMNETGFAQVVTLLEHPTGRLLLLLVLASLAVHVLAGIRHLAFDVHVGVAKPVARQSAIWVIAGALTVILLAGWGLFL